MLPDDLLSYSVAGARVVPHFLGEHDHPWLQGLLEEYERFVGRPQAAPARPSEDGSPAQTGAGARLRRGGADTGPRARRPVHGGRLRGGQSG